ncbi:hypothetical protein BVX95_01675 [archaeon D22]|nr:hypothetical protein BVX95_01675 [archaeon D22]
MVLKKLLGEKLTFTVEGMTCGHCTSRVENALKSLPGVKSASASHEKEEVSVRYDASKTSKEDMFSAIKKEEYTPKD